MTKLNTRQSKFVAAYVAEGNGTKAAQKAYGLQKQNVAAAHSSRLLRNVNIKQAIEDALEAHGATPEFAVSRLKSIAAQDKELGASRLAAKDILELNGWQRGDRPSVTLDIKNAAFFNNSRPLQD